MQGFAGGLAIVAGRHVELEVLEPEVVEVRAVELESREVDGLVGLAADSRGHGFVEVGADLPGVGSYAGRVGHGVELLQAVAMLGEYLLVQRVLVVFEDLQELRF